MKINVAIIGCGRIGFLNDFKKNLPGTYSHFKTITSDKSFNLVAVCDLNSKIRNVIKKKYKIPTYKSYRELLSKHKVELVVVSSSDDSHYKILKDLVKFKPKIVFCEKPLLKSKIQAEEILKIYKKNKIIISVNFSRRFNKYFCDLKKMIDNNYFGEIKSFELKYSRGFYHNAIHWLDLCLWYFGAPIQILSLRNFPSKSFSKDRDIDLKLIYKDIHVKIVGIDIDFLGNEELDIIGTKGRVTVNPDDKFTIYKIQKHKIYENTRVFVRQRQYVMKNGDLLKNAYENIKKQITKKNVFNISSGETSLRLLKMIEDLK